MGKASKRWNMLRHSVLERTRREVIEPFDPFYLIFLGTSVFYLIGLGRLSLAQQTAEYSVMAAIMIFAIATAGLALPFLTGAVLALRAADQKLERLQRG
ncbi:hypothetical protein K3X48_13445 [Aliiroseovarius crassostreae]|uniref:Uncharacterized protein n=1 Tax=Aliiroseovarius crassostreae TaxID=154981 RepID=A0A9Q9H9F1_9RHOB|nr:hypothetical protein [Aliiroseovarius crassostreae]UWP95166.1 hypothetical protein K3X48_13445 [Aliiroseovarius crassostreae]